MNENSYTKFQNRKIHFSVLQTENYSKTETLTDFYTEFLMRTQLIRAAMLVTKGDVS